MHFDRDSIAIVLVAVCSFGLFVLIGFVIRDLPIASDIFESSTFTVVHLAFFTATVGLLSGLVAQEEGSMHETLIQAFFATLGLVVGLGTVMPYVLLIIVFFVYAIAHGITVVSFSIMEGLEARQESNNSRGS